MEQQWITYRSREQPFILYEQRVIKGMARLVHLGLGCHGVTVLEQKTIGRPDLLHINCGSYDGVLKIGQSIQITADMADMYTTMYDGTRFTDKWQVVLEFTQYIRRSNSQDSKLGKCFIDRDGYSGNVAIGSFDNVKINRIHKLPNIQLNKNEFLAFEFNIGRSTPQFRLPILDGFNSSFYAYNGREFRLGIYRNPITDLIIQSLKLVKLTISYVDGGKPSVHLNSDEVLGDWDVEFEFLCEDIDSNSELLIVQHNKTTSVNCLGKDIKLRLVYPVKTDLKIRNMYITDEFNSESVYTNYPSDRLGFTISNPDLFLFMILTKK